LEYSINYEYGINQNFIVRGGYSVPVLLRGFYDYNNVIITGHYKVGNNRGSLDLGAGTAIITFTRFLSWEVDEKNTNLFPVLNIGYRNEPVEGNGMQFKVFFSPMFNLDNEADQKVIPWGGLSLGYKF
jgi:hypothetical protein